MLRAMRVRRSPGPARWVILAGVAASLFGVACGGASKSARYSSAPGGAESAPVESREPVAVAAIDSADSDSPGPTGGAAGLAPAAGPAPAPVPAGQPVQPPAEDRPLQAQPLLIYTATFHLAVFDAVVAIDAIEEMARKRGGYLVQRADNLIIVRVPAPQFHEAVSEVGGLGDVLHRQVSVQDVTAEFRDLELRLRNMYAVRDRVEKLLAQSKNVNEALEVERELERITTAIEQMKGRLKYLSELVAFSTIQVNFQPRPIDQVGSEVRLPFPWLQDLGLPRLLDLSSN